MAFPSFTHATAGTVNFSRAPVSPLTTVYAPRQLRQESENGEVFVYTLSDERIIHTLQWLDLSSADYAAMLAFFRAIPWGADSFTYTDTDSIAYDVRYDGAPFQFQRTAAGTYSGVITLLEEITT